MKKLYRSETNSMLAGVCGRAGGLFRRRRDAHPPGMGADLADGPRLIAYIIAAIIVPKESEVI